RFGITYRLDFYDEQALCTIVTRNAALLKAPISKAPSGSIGAFTRNAALLKAPIEPEGAFEIARRARGTPRVANRLLRRVRDYAQVMSDGVISRATAREALGRLDVDELGLD